MIMSSFNPSHTSPCHISMLSKNNRELSRDGYLQSKCPELRMQFGSRER